MKSLLNDESASDDRPYNLYWVLTLMAKIYTESSALDVTRTAYIESSSGWLELHGGSPNR